MNRDDEPKMTPERADAIRELLMKRLRDEPHERADRRRRRIVVGSLAGMLLVGGVATGATLVLNASQVSNMTLVQCLSSTDAKSDGTYPGSSATVENRGGPGRVTDALALCTQMWEEGALNDDSDPTAPTHAPAVAPPLQVCVLRDGSAAVVPSTSESICLSLGMAPLDDD